jgi:hypothetical protein
VSEKQKFIAAVILVILGGLAAIGGVSLVFYWLGVPPRQASLAGALVISLVCKVGDIIYHFAKIGGGK